MEYLPQMAQASGAKGLFRSAPARPKPSAAFYAAICRRNGVA